MARYTATVDTAWDREEAFAYLADFANDLRLGPRGRAASQRLTDEPLAVGARFEVTTSYMGRESTLDLRDDRDRAAPPRPPPGRDRDVHLARRDDLRPPPRRRHARHLRRRPRDEGRRAARRAADAARLPADRRRRPRRAPQPPRRCAPGSRQGGEGRVVSDTAAHRRRRHRHLRAARGRRAAPRRARGHRVRGRRLRRRPHEHDHGRASPAGPVDVDTGFIVFNDRNYPNFEAMLAELGVPSQPANMSFGVSDGSGRLRVGGARRARDLRPPAAPRRPPVHPHAVRPRALQPRGPRAGRRATAAAPRCATFLEEGRYSDYFIDRLIVPQVSAVWSADPEQMWSFPASFLADVLRQPRRPADPQPADLADDPGRLAALRRGADRPFADRIRLRTPVRARPPPRRRRRRDLATTAASERFDEVVLACHADQALAMLAEPNRLERELLARLPLPAERGRPPHRHVA